MNSNILIFLSLTVFGFFQIQNSFSEDYFSLPSCDTGRFGQDHVQCSTGESPPCMAPSFEKNGFCAVKKIDICKKGNLLIDGDCVPEPSMDNFTITKQHLHTGETISESGMITSILVGSLGPILILFFIIIYAIKKRTKKDLEEET